MQHRRVIVAKHGGPEVLEVIVEAVPEPGPGEVRVRVEAAGVSAYDLMMRTSGVFPGSPKVPFTQGEDMVGVVDAVGEGVTGLEQGQRVGAFTFGRSGTYAEHVCIPEHEAVPVPDGLAPDKAVCLVCNYLTAQVAMHETAQVEKGERALIHGAAGGVGSALVHLGALAGLEMYGTASPRNHDLLRSLGVTPIDYHTEDFVTRVREMTEGGADVVFDPIGGARQVRRSYRALRKGGRLAWFGMAATKKHGLRSILYTLVAIASLKVLPAGKRAPMMGDLSELAKAGDWYQTTLAHLFGLAAAGRIDPIVAARFPLEEASAAHELLERGGYAGKVVLMPREEQRKEDA